MLMTMDCQTKIRPNRDLRRSLSTTLAATLFAATALWATSTHASASTQDNKDTLTLKSGATESGKIKSEDYGGLVIDVKTDKTIPWADIVPGSIHYNNATAYESAKDAFDGGKYDDALKAFDEMKGDKGTRAVLRQHALYYSALIQQRQGKGDEALAGYKELLTAFPKSRYLYDVGENMVAIYKAKKDPASATKALDQLSTDALTAGADPGFSSAVNVLKGSVLEDQKKYAEAQAAFAVAEKATGVTPAVVQQAILGQARCAVALNDKTKAEGLFRKVTTTDSAAPIMAGAWNGLGDLLLEEGRKGAGGKADPDKITDALYCYLRGVVQYVPLPGESSAEYERAMFYSAKCFDYLGQLAPATAKAAYVTNMNQRMDQLRKLYPNSEYLK
jgi:tetratricopeptide (TPR) repeat protein